MLIGPAYDCKSDIFSLGVMLYEMCNLECPFDSHSDYAIGYKILYEPYTPVNQYIHTEEIKTMVDLMLEKDPAKRPDVNSLLNHPIVVAKRQEYGL